MTSKPLSTPNALLRLASMAFFVPVAMIAVPVAAQDANVVIVETEAAPAAVPENPTASALTAQTLVDISKIDLDGSGSLDIGEARAVWPDLTEDGFVSLDLSGDGFIDDTELAAAYESGVLSLDEQVGIESPTGGE